LLLYNSNSDDVIQDAKHQFFLTSLYQSHSTEIDYTIVSNPDVLIAELGGGFVRDCSFALQPDVVFDPGETVPINGAITLHRFAGNSPALRFESSLIASPLDNPLYVPKFKKLGIYVNQGVRLLGVSHTIDAPHRIAVNCPPLPNVTCNTDRVSCSEQFAAFMTASPGRHLGKVECEAEALTGCAQRTWICPTDPTVVQYYWTAAPK
jgi:hypothetical protein